jgi:hypothetical protein
MLQLVGATIQIEDQMEHEEIIHRKHPLQNITRRPIVGCVAAVANVDPTPEANGCHDPEDGVPRFHFLRGFFVCQLLTVVMILDPEVTDDNHVWI